MKIRPATPDDVLALLEMQLEGWTKDYVGLAPQGYLEAAQAKWARPELIEKQVRLDDFYLVAEEAEVMGCICAGLLNPAEAEVYWVHTLERHRGRGVGRRLMQDLLGRLPALVRFVYVTTYQGYTPTIAFYQRLGFEKLREQVVEYFGHPVNDLVLRLERQAPRGGVGP